MKIRELIDLLNRYDPETEVVVSRDSEGNSFSPVDGYSDGIYVADNTWSGEMYEEEEFDQYVKEGEFSKTDAVKAVCLFPVN